MFPKSQYYLSLQENYENGAIWLKRIIDSFASFLFRKILDRKDLTFNTNLSNSIDNSSIFEWACCFGIEKAKQIISNFEKSKAPLFLNSWSNLSELKTLFFAFNDVTTHNEYFLILFGSIIISGKEFDGKKKKIS